MKKLLNVFVCLLALFSSVSFAQNQVFGLRAGVNVSRIGVNHHLKDEFKFGSVLGYNAAVFVKTDLHYKFNLQTELSYSLKGLAYKNTENFVQNFHYISLPVLLNYGLTKNISVAAGLEPSYMLNYKQCKFFVDRRWDLCADADINFNLSPALSLGLRCNLGLIPLSTFNITDSQAKVVEKVKFINQTLQFSLSYRFP